MADKKKKHSIECLECMNAIELKDREYVVGDIIECPFCGSELEVASIKDGKIEVELIEEEK